MDFPSGTIIAPGSYLIIWCDSSRDATTNLQANFNTGFLSMETAVGLTFSTPRGKWLISRIRLSAQ